MSHILEYTSCHHSSKNQIAYICDTPAFPKKKFSSILLSDRVCFQLFILPIELRAVLLYFVTLTCHFRRKDNTFI